MKDFGAHADGVGNVAGRAGNNHVFLEVRGPGSMFAAIHHIHHWHRDRHFIRSAGEFGNVTIERDFAGASVSLGVSERNGQDGVRTEVGFIVGAVEIEHNLIDIARVGGIVDEDVGDFGINVPDCFQYTFATVVAFVAIT